MSRFRLSTKPINQQTLLAELSALGAGACITFEGWVRNHHQDRQVIGLDYYAYSALAKSEGIKSISDVIVMSNFPHLV